MFKSAVCVLVPLHDEFLAISRRNDTTRWGLPGGKVDPGETNLEAVIRESREEASLILDPELLEPLAIALCPGKGREDTYWVTTYLYKGEVDLYALKPEEGFTLTTMTKEQLADPSVSPFAEYNDKVFAAYNSFNS